MAGIGAWNPLGVGVLSGLGGFVLALLLIWSLIWKGWALWKSARKGSKIWFIVLLIVNTFGILEILYIFVFSSMKMKGGEGEQKM